MVQDFDQWNENKKKIQSRSNPPDYFKEGDVMWSTLGVNIGDEENGKGLSFRRPVLVITKFNSKLALVIPLSTKLKDNPFYIRFRATDGRERTAMISQMRSMSSKRFVSKIGKITKEDLEKIRNAAKHLLSGISDFLAMVSQSPKPEGHL